MSDRSPTLTRRTALSLTLAAPVAASLTPVFVLAGPEEWQTRLTEAIKALNLPKGAVLEVHGLAVSPHPDGHAEARAALRLSWQAGARQRRLRVEARDPEAAFSELLRRVERDFGGFA